MPNESKVSNRNAKKIVRFNQKFDKLLERMAKECKIDMKSIPMLTFQVNVMSAMKAVILPKKRVSTGVKRAPNAYIRLGLEINAQRVKNGLTKLAPSALAPIYHDHKTRESKLYIECKAAADASLAIERAERKARPVKEKNAKPKSPRMLFRTDLIKKLRKDLGRPSNKDQRAEWNGIVKVTFANLDEKQLGALQAQSDKQVTEYNCKNGTDFKFKGKSASRDESNSDVTIDMDKVPRRKRIASAYTHWKKAIKGDESRRLNCSAEWKALDKAVKTPYVTAYKMRKAKADMEFQTAIVEYEKDEDDC